MKKEDLYKKNLRRKLMILNQRIKKFGYPSFCEIIHQLEDLLINQLEFVNEEDDEFEKDCVALKYVIELLNSLDKNDEEF